MGVTIIVALFGRVDEQGDKLKELIATIDKKLINIPLSIIYVCDSREWERFISRQLTKNESYRIIYAPFSVARMFNIGAFQAQSESCVFLTLMDDPDGWLNTLIKLYSRMVNDESYMVYAPKCNYNASSYSIDSTRPYSAELPGGYQSGWLEMLDILPMHFSIVQLDAFRKIGGFIESPILSSGFWWAFSVKISRSGDIKCDDSIVINTNDFSEITSWYLDIKCSTSASRDSIARVICRSSAGYGSTDDELVQITDCRPIIGDDVKVPSIKIMVIGGINEPAHNQLCFFNYFQNDESSYRYTWRAALDVEIKDYELDSYDLVIFSRVKSESGVRLAGYCKGHNIPSVYMLDDNWFSVADDWPEYKEILAPGTRMYDCFVTCMLMCDTVLTYNKILAEDVEDIHHNVVVLPTNINLSLFDKKDINRDRVLVGYVGSMRREDVAFRALSQVASERNDFDIFLMSNHYPSSLVDLDKERVIFQPYVHSYNRYAKILCSVKPDILLAPLSKVRTDASKCPNKYLEISACGAVGIYSDVSPYTEVISNEKNGFLVKNDIDSWVIAINNLLDSSALLKEVASNAYMDVSEKYATSIVQHDFFSFIDNSINHKNG
ncbi:TPA: glycosyltransferase [Aeromonas veronii]